MTNDTEATSPRGKAAALLARYENAEGKFDKFLVLLGGLRYTLVAFALWTGFCLWLGAKVFGS